MTLVKVVDGDTVDALIDVGFSVHVKKRIRLYGLNCPESRTRDLEEKARGLAAKAFVETWFEGSTEFVVDSRGVGKYGRCLGVVYGDGINLNDLLVQQGHGVPYFGGKRSK